MKPRAFAKQFWKEFQADRIDDVAAMMTYYAVFALFPMLVFVVTLTLLVAPTDWIDSAVQMAGAAMPPAVAQLLADQVARMESAAGAGFAVGSAVLALWGASRGAASLMTALNDLFEKRESRGWVKRQLVALGTTLVVATLLVIAMALLAVGPSAGHAFADRFGLGGAFDVGWAVARWLLAAFLVMFVWALLYKWLPDTDAPLRIFTPGAITGVLLWFGVTQAFGVYLGHFGDYEKTYGAVASVIVFLTWLWLSNLALLIGAEINDALAELRKDKSAAAAKLAEREKSPTEKTVPST
ncbi:MAG TPA: YihY/virulence factor BrkB family protein [Kofleriaceae bacterium]|nr:YihY/virulence factor BrkB family protein [Kofleriaceae bacterium]